MTAPRVAFIPFQYNYPMGASGDADRHREVAEAALLLLNEMDERGEAALPFEWRMCGGG